MASQQKQQDEVPKAIPLKILVDRQLNKVVAVESTKDFVDTLFSFLSLPLGTIIHLLKKNDDEHDDNNNHKEDENDDDGNNNNNEENISEPILGCITNLYQSAENLTVHDVWNLHCKGMLTSPRNPCEQLCKNLYLNIDDKEPTPKVLVCDSCDRFTTFRYLECVCGKLAEITPHDLDLEAQGETSNNSSKSGVGDGKCGVFVKENGSLFLVLDDLTVVPSSLETSMHMLVRLGYSDLSQLEVVTQNICKHEILNLLRNTLTSHEPLTNTILASNSKKKDKLLDRFASAIRVRPATSDSKMDVKLVRSKSQNRIVFAEAKEDFVDFMFSFLTIPLGSIVKLLDGNSSVGSVDNLDKSVETLDSSWCTDSRSVLLNPGTAPQYGFPNQPLNIPDAEPPCYFYGTGTIMKVNTTDSCSMPFNPGAAAQYSWSNPQYSWSNPLNIHAVEPPKFSVGIGTTTKVKDPHYSSYTTKVVNRDGGLISKSNNGSIANVRRLTALDPRSPNRSKENAVGFVKRPALYAVGDDLRVRPLSDNSCLFYLKELNVPLDDLEVKVISISEAEALSLLGASLTSKYALTSGLEDFLDVPKQESNLTSKYVQSSRLDDLLKDEPNPEP